MSQDQYFYWLWWFEDRNYIIYTWNIF